MHLDDSSLHKKCSADGEADCRDLENISVNSKSVACLGECVDLLGLQYPLSELSPALQLEARASEIYAASRGTDISKDGYEGEKEDGAVEIYDVEEINASSHSLADDIDTSNWRDNEAVEKMININTPIGQLIE